MSRSQLAKLAAETLTHAHPRALSSSAILTFYLICNRYCDPENLYHAFPGHETLSSYFKRNIRTSKRHIQALKKAGLLVPYLPDKSRKYGKNGNSWLINIPLMVMIWMQFNKFDTLHKAYPFFAEYSKKLDTTGLKPLLYKNLNHLTSRLINPPD